MKNVIWGLSFVFLTLVSIFAYSLWPKTFPIFAIFIGMLLRHQGEKEEKDFAEAKHKINEEKRNNSSLKTESLTKQEQPIERKI